MVFVVGKEQGDPNSKPGRSCLHFTKHTNTLEKSLYVTILPPTIGKIVGQLAL